MSRVPRMCLAPLGIRCEPTPTPATGLAALGLSCVLAVIAACSGAGKNIPRDGLSVKDIVKQASPAIVHIETANGHVGTGFVLDPSGLVATNLHVVAGSSEIKVRLADGNIYNVNQVAGFDRVHDLALLRIQPPKALPTLRLGDSDKMTAGDKVIAIGNPLGVLDLTVSDGLLSSVRQLCGDRELADVGDKNCKDPMKLLQFSAAISQGSSGGPLFNEAGEVVGLTTLFLGQGQLLNFAVPANYLKQLVAAPKTIALDEFAKTTDKAFAEHGGGDGGGGDDGPVPDRKVPTHQMSVWDGCSQKDVEDTVRAIEGAIRLGVPLYNTRTKDGYEACARIYEGATLRLAKDGPCKGVRSAAADTLLRHDTIESYRDKAWALRDGFDGLLLAAEKWFRNRPPSAPTPKK
jgi:S1-C subfamily serine protease